MAKTGRNDPCPCGSGKKYKQCCLPKDEAAASEQLALATAPAVAAAKATREENRAALEEHRAMLAGEHDELDDLTERSNAIVDMVHDGKLDEAEQAARDFLVRFPQVHDGYDRLGMVYEARGQNKEAADCYRQAAEFIESHPKQYDLEYAKVFHELVAKLDPSPAPGPG